MSSDRRFRNRLTHQPHPVIVEQLYRPQLERDMQLLPLMLACNRAHLVALVRANAIPPADGAALLRFHDDLEADPQKWTFDPALEDLYLNLEAAAIATLGIDSGGRLQTGRSRNDLNATLSRMSARLAALTLAEALVRVRQSLLAVADRHAADVMTGYTHLQPAQPITFGFYLAAVADALERDSERLRHAYGRCNRSPLGAAALAGTGFAIDRALVARLLGFDTLVENALDAVASRDHLIELGYIAVSTTVTLSRLAQDLYVWSSNEFGVVTVADEAAIVSSIMPQKKNPVILEHVKGKGALALGGFVGGATAIRGTPFSNVRDANRDSARPFSSAIDEAVDCSELMSVTLEGLSFDASRALARARRDFSSATEVADLLVRALGISFRQAHEIVGLAVRRLIERGKDALALDVSTLRDAASSIGSRGWELSDEQLGRALDPQALISSRLTTGSAQPDEVRRMIARGREAIEMDGMWVGACRDALGRSDRELREESARLSS